MRSDPHLFQLVWLENSGQAPTLASRCCHLVHPESELLASLLLSNPTSNSRLLPSLDNPVVSFTGSVQTQFPLSIPGKGRLANKWYRILETPSLRLATQHPWGCWSSGKCVGIMFSWELPFLTIPLKASRQLKNTF